jgi:hypothetical protein
MKHSKHGEEWAGLPQRVLKRLGILLRLEKARRGVSPKRMCFIGMADTAKFWWCAQKSLFESIPMEKEFFRVYLADRIKFAFQSGLISRPPSGDAELLAVAAKPSFEDRQRLFKQEQGRKRPAGHTSGRKHLLDYVTIPAQFIAAARKVDGYQLIAIHGEKALVARPSAQGRTEIYDPFDEQPDPKTKAMMQGRFDQASLAEQHPTFRWHFNWRQYVVVGVPDGIADRFVYEFKSTTSFYWAKPLAECQADLYGYFFGRDHKRIQIYDQSARKVLTLSNAVNRNKAEETLRAFAAVEAGATPIPPKPWKCRKCEFFHKCLVSPLRRRT